MLFGDPAFIDTSLDSRAITFENPNGARGAGGTAAHGRKGAPNRLMRPGERAVLADIDGPGTVRHIWMTFPPAPPEDMRAVWMEVFYDGAAKPSVSVPCLDFFGLPHGRPVPLVSALTAAQEGRGFNAYFPMPFRRHLRVELTNSSSRDISFYYQIDLTLQRDIVAGLGYLHAAFTRENPTVPLRDFVITDGLKGPGRFLGCVVGVRVLDDGNWYGEGEVKVYRDGDAELPTICGTGLEDYVGSAWGMGPHTALYGGAPLDVRSPDRPPQPDFVGFYRWHVPDPIVFADGLRVTIQQIGATWFREDDEDGFRRFADSHAAAGSGWDRDVDGLVARGIYERSDDYCATAFVYCKEPQAVPRLDLSLALAGIERKQYERPSRFERPGGGG